jgi:hypothetical protein
MTETTETTEPVEAEVVDDQALAIREAKGGPLAKTDPMALIASVANDPDCDVEKLERLLALQERMAAAQAQEAWATAMAEFQERAPLIVKTQAADRYAYASHAYIMERIRPLLAECGLSLSFSSEIAADGRIHLTCSIAHGTHVETREFTCPVPKVPGANDTQCMGAALAYGMKYLLVSALNLSVGGMDCDGAPEPKPRPEADENAPKAATRDNEQRLKALYTRYSQAGGPEAGWWPMVAKAIGVQKKPEEITAAEWDKVEVVVGEMEEAGR